MFSSKRFLFSCAVSLGVLSAVACQTINRSAASFGQMTGNETLIKATHDLTPRQEHYLGRSILARILTEKQPVRSEELQNYVNQLGQYLALHSSRTATFKGYRFIVIDDSSLTALSTPGGFVAVSSAMLRLSENEDELASVLAHEIAHVALRHAEQNIKNNNRMAFGQQILSEVVLSVPTARTLSVFTDAISVGINSTFNKSQEFDADEGLSKFLDVQVIPAVLFIK